jgi:hypothetical protein
LSIGSRREAKRTSRLGTYDIGWRAARDKRAFYSRFGLRRAPPAVAPALAPAVGAALLEHFAFDGIERKML